MGLSEKHLSEDATTTRAGSSRKPYVSPELRAYGDIRQITQTLNSLMGNADGMVIGPMILKTGGF